MQKLSVAFLASGNGGTLKAIHHAAHLLDLPLRVSMVVADRACGSLDWAAAHGLPAHRVVYKRTEPAALQELLREHQPDLVVTNIHKIIDADTLGLLPGRFVNLHYSILPAFKGFIGMETVEQARRLNVGIVGATCHAVDEEVDNGRTLAQCATPVDWATDATDQVYDRIFRGASLALLQGLLSAAGAAGPGHVEQVRYHEKPVLFAPSLSFDATRLDDAFWQQVRQ